MPEVAALRSPAVSAHATALPTTATPEAVALWDFAGRSWRVRRPKPFVLVIEGPADPHGEPSDYLHEHLLAPAWREAFFCLGDELGLVVCLNLPTQHATYRDVRGRSSKGRLSQGEYYHHDGCSGPQKPRFVEIRCPYQAVPRHVATAIAPHEDVVRAMLKVLPEPLAQNEALQPWHERAAQSAPMSYAELDQLQGLITRTVRRKLDAEAARAYFREVDREANAFVEPWRMGESRLIANADLRGHGRMTMQHRRAYQAVNRVGEANGHLVKRWPNEELLLPGQVLDTALLRAMCSEEDEGCFLGPH